MNRDTGTGAYVMNQIEFPFMPPDAYSPEGVDRTLIRSMLALSPMERLMVAQGTAQFVQQVRDAQASARLSHDPACADESRR